MDNEPPGAYICEVNEMGNEKFSWSSLNYRVQGHFIPSVMM